MAKTKRDVLELSKKKKQQSVIPKKEEVEVEGLTGCSAGCSNCSSGTTTVTTTKQTIQLPPITEMLPSGDYYSYFDIKHRYFTCNKVKKQPVMPIIPYYYHHRQFGIEACMLQVMEGNQRKDMLLYDY